MRLRSHRSRQNTTRTMKTCAIFIAITRRLGTSESWNQRNVESKRRTERPRGNFTGQRLTLGHAYFREESKQNCMVGATLCTHAAQSRHVEITLRDRFFFVAFPVNGQRAPRRAPSKLEIAVFNAY